MLLIMSENIFQITTYNVKKKKAEDTDIQNLRTFPDRDGEKKLLIFALQKIRMKFIGKEENREVDKRKKKMQFNELHYFSFAK